MSRLAAAVARTDDMVADLAALVGVESPSSDPEATRACGEVLVEQVRRTVGAKPERCTVGGVTHLRWAFGSSPRVLLVGHIDTVWPHGTLARWPFAVSDGRATGPGCFDMKAGLVQTVHALSLLDDLDGVTLLVTADEELGSPSSRALIEETAAGMRAALVMEPSAAGALKTARKGVSMYELTLHGRAAHAGLEPWAGRNAAVAAAHVVLAAARLDARDVGTTVTPTTVAAGTTTNTVPAAATVTVDVRATSTAEQERIDTALRALDPGVDGVTLTVGGGINRRPLEAARSAELFALAQREAVALGLGRLGGVAVGGGSDGNFTAGIGIPTLDGLGAVGDHAHGEGEFVDIAALAPRTALLAALIEVVQRP
ncbi:MAG TPA: M20/M25/M40 family metallo-hydrolase [Mycobacteriales bacterium]|nr:M20/M25/M40 family metallo-hydrolase [Mycobacteriales bacterium]